jgi:hypothetical protein
MRRRDFLLASASLPFVGGIWIGDRANAQAPVENSITLHGSLGGSSNCPIRIARPFVRGEIQSAAQAVMEGRPIPTQCDVKTRWPDGSVQHAILSFIVPRLAGGAIKIKFANQSAALDADVDKAGLLAPRFDFDAQIHITRAGKSEFASARKMLTDGSFLSWCKGPIATTLILADHSVRRAYDFGFEPSRPIRPIFHATFWPTINKVFVRAIAENSNSEALQDVQYDVRVSAGMKKTQNVLEQEGVIHSAATRWTHRFWLGDDVTSALDIDHNVAYLAATRAFPNFDPSMRIPEEDLARKYEIFLTKSRNLYGRGLWMKGMGSTGGRDEIGPYTSQEAMWMFSGDHRMFEVVATQADLAAAWPLQVREGDPRKRFDRKGSISALGRPLSVFARPTLWLFDQRDKSAPDDKVEVHGERIIPPKIPGEGGKWQVDDAHHPDPYSALYTLTGDYFALEQLQLWAAALALEFDPGYKGPAPSGAILGQLRGYAWHLRDRAHAAFLSPDGSPEKEYFRALIDDAVAFWEGMHNIRGTRFEGTPLWMFARTHRPVDNPLHAFIENPKVEGKSSSSPLNLDVVSSAVPLWQNYMMIFELGRAREQGFPTAALLSWSAKVLTGQFAEGDSYSPYNVQQYSTGIRDRQGNYFKTWTDTLRGYKNPTPATRIKPDACDGYAVYAYGASTMIAHEPGGAAAYEWLRNHVYEPLKDRMVTCPKWAYLPRS